MPVRRSKLTGLLGFTIACAPKPAQPIPPGSTEGTTTRASTVEEPEQDAREQDRVLPDDHSGTNYVAAPTDDSTVVRPYVTPNAHRVRAVGLDPAVVLRMVRARINELRYCYNIALKANAELTGTATLTWSFDADGQVHSAMIVTSTLEDPQLHACLVERINRARYPRPDTQPAWATVELNFTSAVVEVEPRAPTPRL